MRNILIFILLCSTSSIFGQKIINDSVNEVNNKQAFDYLALKYLEYKTEPIATILIKVGTGFLGKPYVGFTLENNIDEKLVVNLHEFDCTTFVENCLAIARTIKNPAPNFELFKKVLTNIRYRNGVLFDYTSRLHYFSDWIYDNEKKGLIQNQSCSISNSPICFSINFMTTHSGSYIMLKNRNNFIEKMKIIESEISTKQNCYIPKNELPKFESLIQNGDILAITTNINGLDISHVVLAYYVKLKLHILHASSVERKVVVSTESLYGYLKNRTDATGIMVLRPIF